MLDRPTAALDSYKRHVLGTNLSIYSDSARCHCGRMCELEEKWTEARDFYAAVQGPLKPQAAARAAILPIPAENTSNVSNVENVESSTLK